MLSYNYHNPKYIMTNKTYCTPNKISKFETDLQTISATSAYSRFTSYLSQTSETNQKHQCIKQGKINPRRLSNQIKRQQKLRRRRILYFVLGKIMMTKFYNKKCAFNKFRHLPDQIKFSKAPNRQFEQQIAEKLILKSQVTNQTAVLRSIINWRRKKQKIENPQQIQRKKKQKMGISMLNCHVTIYPDSSQTEKIYRKLGILQLNEILRSKLKFIIKCFCKCSKNASVIRNYFIRMIRNTKQNQKIFINKLRLVNFVYLKEIRNTKKKHLGNLLQGCVSRRERFLVQLAKDNYHNSLIKNQVTLNLITKSVLYKKLEGFFAIFRYSMMIKEIRQVQQRHNEGLSIRIGSQNSQKPEQREKYSQSSSKNEGQKLFKRTSTRHLRLLH